MSVLGADEQAALGSLELVAPQARQSKFSAWSAIPRGLGEAGLQVGATAADLWNSFKAVRDASPEQRKIIDRQGAPIESFSSRAGDTLRDMGRGLRPDPVDASAAESVLYGFARGASKVVAGAVAGGLPGVLAAGVEEGITQSDELRRQGVDLKTRSNVGLVQGAGLALAALPAAGQTLASTAALYLAGGPGGFVAQQALTREILHNAGQDKLGDQFDPFDPVGLAVSALIPAPFAYFGLRGARKAAAAKAAEDFRAGPVPSEPTAVAGAVREAYSPEVVDAAMVLHSQQARAALNPGRADDLGSAAAHEAAMAKAEAQIARGEPVQVADVAPARITPAERDVNFKAWFGDSKVVDEQGAPLVVYHGTNQDIRGFDPQRMGSSTGDAAAFEGLFFSRFPDEANVYAREAAWRADPTNYEGGAKGAIYPVYLSMRNPLTVDYAATTSPDVLRQAKAAGHDGVIDARGDFVVFSPEQVKSATGNSGKFDPNSASLTDPLQEFGNALDQLRRAKEPDAPTRPEAPSPEAAAPARSAGDAPSSAAAAETGRAGAYAQAPGLTPGAKAEAVTAQARMAEVQAAHPDLQVMLDGMDKPMRLDEFMAAVRAEADEMAADAPLMRVAAECALTFGL